MTTGDYRAFLEAKAQLGTDAGFEPSWLPGFLYDFQQDLVEWALRKGRGAHFADCGLGKTPMQLVWAENVVRKTGGRVLPYRAAKDQDDEKHVHPLQLDVIDRVLTLWSNPGETILTPFMGIGSEVYAALLANRKAIGIELKPSYYQQAVRNVERAVSGWRAAENHELSEVAE